VLEALKEGRALSDKERESHASSFVREGVSVLLTDMRVAEGEALAKQLGASARFVRHDVTVAGGWDAVVKEAEAWFGPVGIRSVTACTP
jgi:3alpha(or 20beta)-hydroxysteroid dehydrogenase